MGILDLVEEVAGALGADKALEAVDPNAGLIAKGLAAVAGFKGVEAVKDHLAEGQEQASSDDDTQNS